MYNVRVIILHRRTSYDTILTPVVRYRNKCNETAMDNNNGPLDNATDHSLKA